MDLEAIKDGMRVRTTQLRTSGDESIGMNFSPRVLRLREPNKVGTVIQQHDWDPVFWVQHDDGNESIYYNDELATI